MANATVRRCERQRCRDAGGIPMGEGESCTLCGFKAVRCSHDKEAHRCATCLTGELEVARAAVAETTERLANASRCARELRHELDTLRASLPAPTAPPAPKDPAVELAELRDLARIVGILAHACPSGVPAETLTLLLKHGRSS